MKRASGRKGQGGSVLLEALIAILVFSIGILALVGMQASAISNMNDAKYRTEASFLANQVIAEMWANRNNLAAYAYAGGAVPGVLDKWVSEVQSALPNAQANPPQIAIGAGNQVTVTVFWRPPNTAAPHNYVVVAYINI
jgi:type IV pilus assembly protein PilV